MLDREPESASGTIRSLQRSDADRSEKLETPSNPAVERDPLDRVACRAGDDSCASAHASTLNRATHSQPARAGRSLLQLQKQYGNRYVERVLTLARESVEPGDASGISPQVERTIQQKRGGGQSMDSGVRGQMESSFGANFEGVRVHTDHQSDSLNRELSARAFTTGQDIFFRQGAYQPASSSGRELLAHELTHVVQQGGDQVRRAMSVSQPGDPHEVEAEQTARAVMQQEHGTVASSNEKEEESPVMASHLSGEVRRQPENPKEEDEEKKKHHAVMKAGGANLSRQMEKAGAEQP
jgi:hypothetical protein